MTPNTKSKQIRNWKSNMNMKICGYCSIFKKKKKHISQFLVIILNFGEYFKKMRNGEWRMVNISTFNNNEGLYYINLILLSKIKNKYPFK